MSKFVNNLQITRIYDSSLYIFFPAMEFIVFVTALGRSCFFSGSSIIYLQVVCFPPSLWRFDEISNGHIVMQQLVVFNAEYFLAFELFLKTSQKKFVRQQSSRVEFMTVFCVLFSLLDRKLNRLQTCYEDRVASMPYHHQTYHMCSFYLAWIIKYLVVLCLFRMLCVCVLSLDWKQSEYICSAFAIPKWSADEDAAKWKRKTTQPPVVCVFNMPIRFTF